MYKVLVADDEAEVIELLKLYLEKDGFTVLAAENGVTALGVASTEKLDCAVLDVMMPELNGFQLLKKIREKSDIPVIMLTARVASADKVLGLDMGADDYVTKPFDPLELCARIKANIRRYHASSVTLVIIPVLYSLMCKNENQAELKGKTVPVKQKENTDDKKVLLATGRKLRRCEIIANQSVEDDIIELLESTIQDFEYTVDENLYGRGRKSRKLGNNVWPEMNFVLTAYVNSAEVQFVRGYVEQIKQKFPNEGINLFVI